MKRAQFVLSLPLLVLWFGCGDQDDPAPLPQEPDPTTPATEIEIERSWSMIAYGQVIGMIRSQRRKVEYEGRDLIRTTMTSVMETTSVEKFWVGPSGLEVYDATFPNGDGTDTKIKGELMGSTFFVDLEMGETYSFQFEKDVDYHWSVVYIDYDRIGFVPGEPFQKRILDFYDLESKVVTGTVAPDETVQYAGQSAECHVVRFDYPGAKGTMWLAEDELGWFLVKEEAEAEGEPFQLILDEYSKNPIEPE